MKIPTGLETILIRSNSNNTHLTHPTIQDLSDYITRWKADRLADSFMLFSVPTENVWHNVDKVDSDLFEKITSTEYSSLVNLTGLDIRCINSNGNRLPIPRMSSDNSALLLKCYHYGPGTGGGHSEFLIIMKSRWLKDYVLENWESYTEDLYKMLELKHRGVVGSVSSVTEYVIKG